MILTDCHAHSIFSSDSETPVEDMILKAIALGFDRFYLTDHMDYDFPVTEGLTFLFSPDDYFKKLDELKETYKGQIKILTGVELGLKTSSFALEQMQQLLHNYSFDLVIGSTHLVDNVDLYHPDFWKERSERENLQRYFASILKNIKAFSDFQILGHFDYAIRYSPSGGLNFKYTDYKNSIDEVLKFIIKEGIALEVNCAGYLHKCRQPNPGPEIIRRYLTLGGTFLTIGSDGHTPEYYAYCFNEARKLLLSMGVKNYTTYEKGKAVSNIL